MDHFYHYLSAHQYAYIMRGGGYGRTGLLPLRRLLNPGLAAQFNLPARLENNVIYGLAEPMPPAWMKDDYDAGIGTLEFIVRRHAMESEKMILLKCHTLRSDRAYVLDHSYHTDAAYRGRDADNPVTGRVKRDYWESRIPLRDYRGEHPMGEVVCFDRIPCKRLEIARVHDTLWSLCNELRAIVGRDPMPPMRVLNLSKLKAHFNV